ncbi:MAG: stage II sporulation protein M [Pseudomonadota bacterium]
MQMEEITTLRSVRFRHEREADWAALEALLARAERGGAQGLDWNEARQLARSYQQTSNALSVAREISLDKSLVDYLEALVARAYLVVYAPQQSAGGLTRAFFLDRAPRAVRACWLDILIGTLAMAIGAFVGFGLFFQDPAWFHVFVPGGLAAGRGPGASTETLREILFQAPEASGLGVFAAYLFSHNTRVAIFIFGLGAFACVPAILLTIYNGTILGAFFALYVDRDMGWELGGWLSIHGVTELGAICVAAGGGIRLGRAVLFPGPYRRRDALRLAGRDAVKLALVAALMLVAAAALEGFGRQLIVSTEMRYLIGWGAGVGWISWFAMGGRAWQGR